MAKKSTTTEIKEEVNVKVEEEVKTEVSVETPAVTEVKTRTIIANTSSVFRKAANLEAKYVIGEMPAGIAFEIEKEVSNRIYGDFYLLKNGYYITKNGNYTLN